MNTSAARDAPAFDFYPERWSHGTRHMSKVERTDYLDLLVFQWTEQGIPGDLNAVARVLGYKKGSQIPAAVLEKFPVCEDGKRRNARLESIRAEQRERIRKKSEQRKSAAHTRWHGREAGAAAGTRNATPSAAPADPVPPSPPDAAAFRPHVSRDAAASLPHGFADAAALRTQCPPPTTHHPPQIPAESTPLVPKGDGADAGHTDDDRGEEKGIASQRSAPLPAHDQDHGSGPHAYAAGFEEFWQAYPHKVGKGGAWRVWRRIRDRPPNPELLAALERQKGSTQWRRDHGRYIPHPATWLNQRRWEDEGRGEEKEAAGGGGGF
jgi:uncharacterized protein YdaU (DUF1376 family)